MFVARSVAPRGGAGKPQSRRDPPPEGGGHAPARVGPGLGACEPPRVDAHAPASEAAEPPLAPPPGAGALFAGYLRVGLLGFGGVNAISRRVLVEERRWLAERDYAEILGLGQVLPGPNVGNAAIMVGRRFAGLPGALAATAGLYAAPLAILLGLALAWDALSAHPPVRAAMAGVAAAAAGVTVGTALRMGERLRLGAPMVVLALAAVLLAAWLRWPLPAIVLALGVPGVWLAWRGLDRPEGRAAR